MQSENEFSKILKNIQFFSDKFFSLVSLLIEEDSLYTIKNLIKGVLKCFIISE